jgi:transposase
LIRTGRNEARVIYRANALNMRDKGLTAAEVADFLEITPRTVFNIEENYEAGGLDRALYDDPRPGAPVRLDDRFKCHVVATVCADPPEGFDRWTLDLIREHVLQSDVVSKVSTESIRLVLKEHDLKPWQQRSWCVPKIDEAYIANMEDVLEVYERKEDPSRPLVCIDEKPIQLLDHARPPSGLQPGKPLRVDYEYKRKGTCNVFCAVRPLAGEYLLEVTERRTAPDFARFIKQLDEHYSQAEKIVLVMDNLNTHREKSLTDFFGPEEGARIWNRFEVHYTPKHGSWLNQAEIAINIYARQCLGKSRIPNIELLRKKTNAWCRYINGRHAKIQWTFTRTDAQKRFGYP